MGNFITPPPTDNLPKYYSYQHTKDLIQQLNSLCKQNAQELGFQLHAKSSELQYNNSDWRRSRVPGTVTIRNQNSRTYNITLSLKTIYKAHQTMRHFQKKLSQSKITPQQSVTPEGSEQCCICMDKTPTIMLPCFHTFCANCTQIHIMQKQQKKCPLCRQQFHDDASSLEKKLITVIGDEQSLINDLRCIILGYLKQLNRLQTQQIQKEISKKPNKSEMLQQRPQRH